MSGFRKYYRIKNSGDLMMRVGEWALDVFTRGWWQRIWFGITAPLGVATALFGPHVPPSLRWAPLGAFLLGFVLSNIDAYSAVKKQAEEVNKCLRDLTARVKQVQAGEHFLIDGNQSRSIRHTLVIEFLVAFRNGDGQYSRTVEVENCTCNVANASLEDLKFLGDPHSSLASPPGPYRNIDAGNSGDAVVNAAFNLPENMRSIEEKEIRGVLYFVDSRGQSIEADFLAPLLRNEPVIR
jgi:hypothetical protein